MMAPQIAPLNKVIDMEALADYLLSRRNPDGGFCFYGLDESSLNDTFHAVQILDMIDRLPEDQKTVEYVRSFQTKERGFSSIYGILIALKALKTMDASPTIDSEKQLLKLCRSHRIHDEVYIESASIFESSYYLADMLAMVGLSSECKRIADTVVEYRLKDGNFGRIEPTLASTYYALAIFAMAGRSLDEYKDAMSFVNACAVSSGGFSKKPGTGLAFMDETYYAVMALQLLNKRPTFEKETIDFVSRCQNENGGFRRALASGISGFETSYYAIESLHALLNV